MIVLKIKNIITGLPALKMMVPTTFLGASQKKRETILFQISQFLKLDHVNLVQARFSKCHFAFFGIPFHKFKMFRTVAFNLSLMVTLF